MNDHPLDDLLGALCNGVMTDAEFAQLEARLAADPAARRAYRRYMNVHSTLRRYSLAVQRPAPRVQGSGVRGQASTPTLRPLPGGRSVWYAAAALIALAITAWFIFSPSPQPPALSPVATRTVALLTGSSGAQWADTTAPATLGAELSSGTLSLTRGTAQVMFHSGAVVTLQGPCEFDLTDDGEAFLRRGLVHAYVPPRARGFRIAAPEGVSVIDLGTEFAMRVDAADQTSVRVFEGMVMLRGAGGSMERTFTTGQAARVVRGSIHTAGSGEVQLPRRLYASVIEWGRPFDVTGPGSIDRSGTPVEAVTAAGHEPVDVPIGDEGQVLSFEPRRVWGGGYDMMIVDKSLRATPLGQVLTTCTIGHGPVQRIELTDLVAGARYQVQVFYADERNAARMTIADADETAEGVLLSSRGTGLGQSAIGRFTASGSTRTLTVTAGPNRRNAHVNAWVLRRIDEKDDTEQTTFERNEL